MSSDLNLLSGRVTLRTRKDIKLGAESQSRGTVITLPEGVLGHCRRHHPQRFAQSSILLYGWMKTRSIRAQVQPRPSSMMLPVRMAMMMRFLFWDSNLIRPRPLKKQGKIRPHPRTHIPSPGELLFWAPATLKALKMLGDRQKDGPQRAFVTTNCYGKMAHLRAESPGKPSLLRAEFAIL